MPIDHPVTKPELSQEKGADRGRRVGTERRGNGKNGREAQIGEGRMRQRGEKKKWKEKEKSADRGRCATERREGEWKERERERGREKVSEAQGERRR